MIPIYTVASDGTIQYSNVNTASMKSYLIEKFDDESSSDTLKTMWVDMLTYGDSVAAYMLETNH